MTDSLFSDIFSQHTRLDEKLVLEKTAGKFGLPPNMNPNQLTFDFREPQWHQPDLFGLELPDSHYRTLGDLMYSEQPMGAASDTIFYLDPVQTGKMQPSTLTIHNPNDDVKAWLVYNSNYKIGMTKMANPLVRFCHKFFLGLSWEKA